MPTPERDVTSTDIAPTTDKPIRRRRPIGQVRGKLRTALDAMVWDALPRKQAAEKAGMTEHGLYKALRKAPVRAAYLAELEVLRTSERARNIHALIEVRDQTDNSMARVAAVKAMQATDEVEQSRGAVVTPGLTVVVISQQPPALMVHQRSTEANPLIEHDTGPHAPAALPAGGNADD